ncbi:helix-turn-helix transcriptional regulator [Agromyces luteolus]|uniref:helix-turn-helix transcriptional regulator n=1 Tax=Agromyces luteolus TaxID=88373 RepID=UPI00141274D7|nr:LuxR family transcriptional regulator [Agromyces luteolus]GLK26840.1 helix-turn-helix transcriptional regulator [Agromyces luteolus]
MAAPSATRSTLVGREVELEFLLRLLDRACGGEAQTVVVSGDAGVGKTALVTTACAARDDAGETLIGACLPLTSMSIPFLPIRSALRANPRIIAPPVAPVAGEEREFAVRFDAWLDDQCDRRPITLVIDDVQWADRSTLDTLMYAIAGPASRRLAIVVTLRAGEVGIGHPLQRWLADIRRLPRTSELRLTPLDRAGTAAQVESLLESSPHQSLIDDVHAHTRGNPYFTRLLVAGLPPSARAAPIAFPIDLNSAVLQSWFRLSPETRRIATVLAVGGSAMRADELADVMVDPDAAGVRRALAEATDSGTMDRLGDDSFWFHHPMGAEVLAAALTDDERREWHRRFADLLEARAHQPVPTGSVIAIADHRYRSGEVRAAFDWTVRAADAVAGSDGRAEQVRLLRRAVDLLSHEPDLSDADAQLDALLRRQRAVAADAGATFDELEAVEMMLERLDAASDPLGVAELLVRRMHLRFMAGLGFIDVSGMRAAVRLASVDPASAQYALALAELAHAEIWAEAPEAAAHAREAIAVARGVNDPRALSHALAAGAMAALVDGDRDLARAYGEQGVEAGLESRDWFAYEHAVLWEGNAVETWASDWFADRMAQHRSELVAIGGPPAYVAWVSANEAGALLAVGRVDECEERLRVALGSDAGPLGDVLARLTASRFAALRGRQVEAQSHLLRAEELFADGSAFLTFEFDAVRAEVRLAAADPRGAYDAALAGATGAGAPPTMCEWLMPFAARALADLAQAARDTGADADDVLAELDGLVERFPQVIRDAGVVTPHIERQITAFDAWYAAEQVRARGRGDASSAWSEAAEACASARLPWEEAYSRWRAAEALLGGANGRQAGARELRRGLGLARRLGARPVEDELIDLAARARVPVEEPNAAASEATGALPGLTGREREVLALVAVGRTYSEIAHSLMISEKTVSTHVSHLLDKTGTANRVELARLVHRLDDVESAGAAP